MVALYEGLMPTGFAIRVRQLRTKEKLALDARVEKMKGGSSAILVETVKVSLAAYTGKLELKRVAQPVLDADGRPVLDESGQPVTQERLDVDATLAAVPAGAWKPCNYESLSIDGPEAMYEIFANKLDFSAACALINGIDLKEVNNDAVASGKVRVLSG